MAHEQPVNVWICEDDASLRWVMEEALQEAGFAVTSFPDAEALIAAEGEAATVITDIRLPSTDGLALLDHLRAARPETPVIVITAHSDLEHAVAAYERGAFEYLPKPFDVEEMVGLVRRAVAGGRRSEPAPTPPDDRVIIGRSPAMQEVFRAIGRLARASMAVLVHGESGTGKELVARALHRHSPQADGPFVALNTAAIPAELMESELFGHEKGAFTGADARRRGRFEEAHRGTLFLDEIGDMPMAAQTRLLRVLAEGEFYRVGGQSPVAVDVRVVAATHQDLAGLVAAGRFREDLFHRLDVIRIRVPPLRERREDVPELLAFYLGRAAEELGTLAKTLAPDAATALAGHDWPGNVRELVNLCRRLTVLAPGREIHRADLPEAIAGGSGHRATDWSRALADWTRARVADGGEELAVEAVAEAERTLIAIALEATGGHRQKAAKLLGWGRNTLTRKIQALGLDD